MSEAQEAQVDEIGSKPVILHELNQLEYGGVERVVLTIAKHDTRHQHVVLTYQDGPMRKEFEAAGIPIHHVPPGGSLDLAAWVIHIHTGGAISKVAKDMGESFPIVETIHSPVKSAVRREFVRRKIGVSKAVAELNPGAAFIHNGLDFSRYENPKTREQIRSELGIPQDAVVIGRIGRVAPDKYLEEFLLACKAFQKAHGNNIYVVIAGQESSKVGYRARCKLMAECLPVKNCVFPEIKGDEPEGFFNPKDILPAFDVFLYPSKEEGFGLVFIEAMLLGVPVVTYKTPVTMEILGGYAVLTDKTIRALADGIDAALDPSIRGHYEVGSPQFVHDQYDGIRMANDYGDLYEQVLEEERRKECPASPISSAAE